MSEIRVVASTAWYCVAATAFAGAVAYKSGRSASRSTAAAITELHAKIDALAAARRADYWAVYADVQHDLLLNEMTGGCHVLEISLSQDHGKVRRLLARLGHRRHEAERAA